MKIKKICEQCGKEFSIEFSKRIQRFCNRKCFLINKQKENILKKCQFCGKPFWVSPSKEKYHFPKYCSRSCLYKSGHGKRENHWHWKGITAIRKCLICGNEFKPKALGRGLATKHCSVKCARNSLDYKKRMSGKNSPSWKGGKEKGVCCECGKKIKFYPRDNPNSKYRFCNSECRAKFVGKLKDKKILVNCSICGETFKKSKSRKYKVNFCSHECMKEYWKNEIWSEDGFIYSFFKGKMFGKGFEPTELDKEIIRTRVRLFKIQRKEVKTDETNRI